MNSNNLKPFVRENLVSMGFYNNDSTFDKIFQLWVDSQLEFFEFPEISRTEHEFGIHAHQVLPHTKHDDALNTLSRDEKSLYWQIMREATFLNNAITSLDYGGCPTFSEIPIIRGSQNVSRVKMIYEIVALYFTNSIYSPSPTNIREVLKMKENKLIDEWRQKVLNWSAQFQCGKYNDTEIRREIKDANEYIKGAKVLARLVPFWSVLLTLPFDIATHTFSSLLPLQTTARVLDISSGFFQLYGGLVETAVESPNREKYRWLMISNK